LPDVHAGYGFAIGKLEKQRKKHLKYLLVVQHSTAKLNKINNILVCKSIPHKYRKSESVNCHSSSQTLAEIFPVVGRTYEKNDIS